MYFEMIKFGELSRLMQHNFVKFGDNWIKFGNLSYIWTRNRCAKFQLKIPSRLANIDKSRRGNFFDSHCILNLFKLTHNLTLDSTRRAWRMLVNFTTYINTCCHLCLPNSDEVTAIAMQPNNCSRDYGIFFKCAVNVSRNSPTNESMRTATSDRDIT